VNLHLIATAEFANGERFSIHKFDTSPGCMVTNLRTGGKTRTGTEAKAWSSVRYMARIGQASEHTPGVEAEGYYKLMRELSGTR
jgi:hypothetical protein